MDIRAITWEPGTRTWNRSQDLVICGSWTTWPLERRPRFRFLDRQMKRSTPHIELMLYVKYKLRRAVDIAIDNQNEKPLGG